MSTAYVRNVWMVAPEAGISLDEIAADVGATVVRRAGRSGYGALSSDDPSTADRLRADDRVRSLSPMGITRGAGSSLCKATDLTKYQWHLDAIGIEGASRLSKIVVAVLDTGVAYENYSALGRSYVKASSFTGVTFVSPYDYVNDDAHPNDDHQHGTHVASTIAAACGVEGVAPRVSIMPVKVLNSANEGTEIDLVDGIYHAIDNGADVINLSLSFAEGYFPSPALQEALVAARDAGAVVVAASGNDGHGQVAWPARSRLVIGVGASALDGKHEEEDTTFPAYSNIGLGLDVLAPGGDLTRDANADGYADGILGQTIALRSPSRTSYTYMEGTSQAAAVVSGAAALLLASGAEPDEVGPALRAGARTWGEPWSRAYGLGAGSLSVEGALDALEDDDLSFETWHAALMPYLATDTAGVRPSALVGVVDDEGAPVAGATAWVSIDGSGFGWTSCETDEAGLCTVQGDAQVKASELSWIFSVESVERSDVPAHRPGAALFVSDDLVAVTEDLEDLGALDDALLAFSWEEGEDEALGTVEAAWAIPDFKIGAAVGPMAALMTTGAIEAIADIEEVSVEGEGYLSDPLGLLPTKVAHLDGSGYLSDPLGLKATLILAVPGSSWTTTDSGLAVSATSPLEGAGYLSDPLGVTAFLSLGTTAGRSLDGTAMGVRLAGDGFVSPEGYGGPGLLLAAGLIVESPDDSLDVVEAAGALDLED